MERHGWRAATGSALVHYGLALRRAAACTWHQSADAAQQRGDKVVFHIVTFPLTSNASREEIVQRLNQLRPLRQETPTLWNWIGQASSVPTRSRDPETVTWKVTMEGSVVLGNLELQERALSLSVNSAARAERGKAMLAATLTELVGSPLTQIQTVEQMEATPCSTTKQTGAEIPFDARAKLVHAMLYKQYRALRDEPIPMLGDASPHAAARSAQGRRNLAAWLKHVENRSRNAPEPNDPMGRPTTSLGYGEN
jgi:hypothetical protein